MTVTPIEFEVGRFRVWSRHEPLDAYIVDLRYQEDQWHKTIPLCGCIRGLAYGEQCAHLDAVVAHELNRLHL